LIAGLLREELFVCLDLAQVEDAMGVVCNRAGIHSKEVAAVLLSPPCETYTVTDATNQTRGNHYRNHQDESRPPRSLESCNSAEDYAKRETALKHDRMVQNLLRSLATRKQRGEEFEIIMENPVGSMAKQEWVNNESWSTCTVQRKVNYCAYGKPYRKATHIWTTLKDWQPKGNTGSGRCEWRCGQLSANGRHPSEKGAGAHPQDGPIIRRHKQAIGAEPSRLPKGPQQRQKIWSIPEQLQQELLNAMPERTKEAKYVIDLFSGGESWRAEVESRGYTYIGVDLRRATKDRNHDQSTASKRGGGVVVESTRPCQD
jgi:hypothetical protein